MHNILTHTVVLNLKLVLTLGRKTCISELVFSKCRMLLSIHECLTGKFPNWFKSSCGVKETLHSSIYLRINASSVRKGFGFYESKV